MNNKHLVNIPIAYMKENDKKMNEMKQGIYKDIDGVHADLNTVKTDVLEVNAKTNDIGKYLDSIQSEVDNLPKVIEARNKLTEEVSKSYADGKINEEEAKRIADVLQAIKEAKGYTNVAKIGTEEYINSIKTEVIDYSDTLLHNLESSLGPLAWEDKVELARLGETIIDGGYLKTELIKAHSIGAEKINTNELVVGTNIGIGESIPLLIEERSTLAETVSKAYADGVVDAEEARSIQATLDALNTAKDYTDTSEANAKTYADGKLIESIDYSDTLISQLESSLGPLAWGDKVELARLGSTVIDGGYLKTELIKANSIGAAHINTDELIVGQNIGMSQSVTDNFVDIADARARLAEEVSKSYVDGKLTDEGAARVQEVLNALNEAKGYTDTAKIDSKEYADGIKSELIDYSDTLLFDFEEKLGPLAFEDKIEFARLGQTIVDGGYLKTELIKAHSIGARHINTDELIVGDNITLGPNAIIEWSNLAPETQENLKGEDGAPGDKGDRGPKGDKGDKGDTGEQGLRGLQGAQGNQGIKGIDGVDGTSSYTHIAYSTSSTGSTGFSTSDPVNKTYIGMYVDNVITDSQTPSKYKWTLIKGADGSNGTPGTKGADGKTPYLHIAYATNSTGTTGFSTTVSTGKTYIGQYTDFILADSTDASKYKWTLIKGDKGDTGNTGAKGDKGDTGAKGATGDRGPQGAIGTSVSSITEYYQVSTSKTTAPTTWLTTMPNMTATNKYLWNYEKINFSDGDSQDTIPVVIGAYGDKGSTGATGRSITGITEYYLATSAATGVTKSTSGWTTTMQTTTTTNKYLWNYEKITWSSGTTTTYVEPIIIGIHGATGSKGDTGSTGSKGDKGDKGDKGNTGDRGPQGVIGPQGPQGIKGDTGPTGSRGPQGVQGPQGTTGRGVSQIRTQYYLSTSKTSETGGSWSYTAPTWSPGKYVWTRSVITYTNPTEQATTTAMVDSSWEAVNEIEVGGRNFALSSNFNVTNSSYRITSYTLGEKIPVGTQMTLSLSGELGAGKTSFAFYNSGGNKVFTYLTPATKGSDGIYRISFNWPSAFADDINMAIYTIPSSTVVSSTIKWIKLEKGNKSTDWTPAPEDVQGGIDKSVKSVTVQYNLSTSHTTANGSWVNTAPAYVQDKYMWTRTVTVLNDGTTTYAPSTVGVLIAGAIPNYITSTKITNTTIEAPTISGTTGRFAGTVLVGAAGNTAGITGVGSSASSVRFWAGSSSAATAPFRVTQDGSVTMTKANIETKAVNGAFIKIDGNTIQGGKFITGSDYTLSAGPNYDGTYSGNLFLYQHTNSNRTTLNAWTNYTTEGVTTNRSNFTIRSNGSISINNPLHVNGSINAQEGGNVPTIEEGTWTPTFISLTGSSYPNLGYESRIGYYYKIGNLVYIYVYVVAYGGATNAWSDDIPMLSGLPFAPNSSYNGAAFSVSSITGLTASLTNRVLTARMINSTPGIILATSTQTGSVIFANGPSSGSVDYGFVLSGVYSI